MPVYTITSADKDMPAEEVALTVRDFDPAIEILAEKDGAVEAEMTEQQAGDFLATYADWRAEKIAFADINKPAFSLHNIRKALKRGGLEPS